MIRTALGKMSNRGMELLMRTCHQSGAFYERPELSNMLPMYHQNVLWKILRESEREICLIYPRIELPPFSTFHRWLITSRALLTVSSFSEYIDAKSNLIGDITKFLS